VAEPLDSEATNPPPFKWAGGEVGKRHRPDGEPAFRFPVCSCTQQMTFYGQLDSVNDEFVLADCGIVCVFVCFHCFATEYLAVFMAQVPSARCWRKRSGW
jgi:hypothetical protein